MKKKNDHFQFEQLIAPWNDIDNTILLASSINIFRNIEKYKFPSKASSSQKKQIISLVNKELVNIKNLKNPRMFNAEDLSPSEKDYLAEHFINIRGFHHAQSGEAFIIDDTGKFLATLNVDNHIHLQLLDVGESLESTWNRLVNIEVNLGKALTYSFSPRYGFLTTSIDKCGTGLNINVFLQPSALIHTDKIDDALEKYTEDGIRISGIHGDPSEIIGDIIVLKNLYTLTLTEEDIITILQTAATKLIIEEKRVRKQLKQDGNPELIDRISRAYGILAHSYQIEAVEALNAISLLKLGVDLGWVKGITPKALNELFFNCRRAHLIQQLHQDIKKDELLHTRTEFIHEAIKKVKISV